LTAPLEISILDEAQRDIAEACEWWEENRPDAPNAIRDEIDHAFNLISSQPHVGAPAVTTNLPNVRRLHLGRIRYHLYYRVTSSAVEVLAFWHSSRGSGPPL